jgi:hypothetical protein
MQSPDWPFDEHPHVGVFTTRQVLDEEYPILLVTHDADDGAWQILCGTTSDPDDGRIVGLIHMFERDPGIGELADLPHGWRAWREAPDQPWQREPCEPDDEK